MVRRVRYASALASVVDVGATVVGVSKLAYLGFVSFSKPIASAEIALARLNVKVANTADSIASRLGFDDSSASQRAEASLAKVEAKHKAHNDRLKKLSKETSEFWDSLLDENASPGARLMQTIESMMAPLGGAAAAQGELTTAISEGATAEEKAAAFSMQYAEAIQKVEQSIQSQIDTFGMSRREIELHKLAAEGATDEDLVGVRQRMNRLDEMERAKNFQDKADQARERRRADAVRSREQMFSNAAQAVDSLKTAEDKYQDKLADLNKWLDVGAITFKQFGQLRDAAQKELEKPIQINFEVKGLEANVAGSAKDLLEIEEQIAKARSMSLEAKSRSEGSPTSGLDSLLAGFNANAASIRNLSSESGSSGSPEVKVDNADLVPVLNSIAESTARMADQTGSGAVLIPANL